MPTAVDIYRVTLPMTYINKNVKDMQCAWMPLRDAQTNLGQVLGYDIIVLPRYIVREGIGEIATSLRHATGSIIVFETDDDYSNTYRKIAPESMEHMVTACDYATVSTPGLRRMINKISKTHCYVVENSIEFNVFSTIARQTGRQYAETTIMLVGTTTHYEDWLPAARAALRIARKRQGVRILVGGYQPDYLQKATYLPPVSYIEYPAMLAQADIVLCAVDSSDRFNDSKSAIKAIEAWSAERPVGKRRGGAAVIASKGTTYGGIVQHNHNGLLVGQTEEEWGLAIERLLDKPLLRQNLQCEGYKDAQRHGITSNWKKWYRAYKDMIRRNT